MELIMDNTMLSDHDTCPTRFYWRHIRHLRLIGESTAALDYGTAWHRALEAYYLSLQGGNSHDASTKSALEEFAKNFAHFQYDFPYTLEHGLNNLVTYWQRWPRDPTDLVVKQVEVNLQWELSSDLVFCGRIDLLALYLNNLHIIDHKTGKSISNTCPRPNHQFSGYDVGLSMLGYNAHMIMINLTAVQKTQYKHDRIFTVREPWELEYWRQHVLATKVRIDESLDSGVFERTTTFCKRCEYRMLCETNPESVEALIPLKYEESKWEPWREAGEETNG